MLWFSHDVAGTIPSAVRTGKRPPWNDALAGVYEAPQVVPVGEGEQMKRYTVKRITYHGRIAWGVRDRKLGRLIACVLFRSVARCLRWHLNGREYAKKVLKEYYKSRKN